MDARPRAELRRIADAAADRLRAATAEDILSWAGRTFGDRLAVASSMADTVLVDLAARHAPGVHVLFLDTGYHFPETLGTRDAMLFYHAGMIARARGDQPRASEYLRRALEVNPSWDPFQPKQARATLDSIAATAD